MISMMLHGLASSPDPGVGPGNEIILGIFMHSYKDSPCMHCV